jgi:hypothetical protein
MSIKWFSGPPPARGWWPASIYEWMDTYRWWNGERWSNYAMNGDSLEMVRINSEQDAIDGNRIKWRHWSPEIDGTDGKGAHE